MDARSRAWAIHAVFSAGVLLLGLWCWAQAVHLAHHGVGLSGDAALMLAAAALAAACAVHLFASSARLAWRMRNREAATATGAQKFAMLVDVGFLASSPLLLRLGARLFGVH